MAGTRRIFVVVLAMLGLLVAACGGGGDTGGTDAPDTTAGTDTTAATDTTVSSDTTAAAGEGQTLLIWADEIKIEPLSAVAPAFTEATGVEVQLELVPFGDIREQVNLAAPAGEGPDIFVGAHDWTGELAANGLIDPIELGGKTESFVPIAVEAFGFEGSTYAVPYVTEAIALFYNMDLVPEPPATFDEMGAACEAAGTETCVVLPGGGSVTDAYHNYIFNSAFGATIFAYDAETGSYDASEVLIDSPEGVQGADYLAAQVESGVVASTDGDTAKSLFLDGTAPFFISGPWQISDISATEGLNWGVSVIPPIGDAPTQPFVGAQGFFINSFSENKLLAQSFVLDFIATDEVMQALYDADPRGTAWLPVLEGLADDPVVQTFAESAINGVPMPNVPEMGAVWGPLGDNMLLVRNGELGGQEAATTAAEAIRSAVGG